MKIRWEDLRKNIPLLCILLVATVLRFFKISEFQFDSDELSAIFRAQNANTWQEHIQNGVMIDGHPAGMQTLIWIWAKLVSVNPLPLKIFTAFFGVINIALIFAISRNIFNEKSAIFASLASATLWWQIDLSVWVRPYILGQFFVLIAIWTLNFRDSSIKKWPLLSLAITGAFYLHHFAFLTVFVCVLTVFLLNQEKRLSIYKALGLFALLAIPQFSILITQLKIGGLDWLGKPTPDFFWKHVLFIFNQSIWGIGVIVLAMAFGLYYNAKTQIHSHRKTAILFFVIWFVPMIIGYAYSLFFKPVLQNNVLFFSYPLFIMGIGFFFQNMPKWFFWCFQSSFLLLFIFQLGFTKKRYSIEVNEVYFKQIEKLNVVNPSNTYSIVDGPMDVFLYHQNNVNSSENALQRDNIWNISQSFSYNKLWEIISTKTSKYNQLLLLSNSGTRPELRPILYYFLRERDVPQNFIGGQIDYFNFENPHLKTDFQPNLTENSPLQLVKSLTIKNNECVFLKFGSKIKPNDLYFIELDQNKLNQKINIVTAIVNNRDNVNSSKQIDWRSSSCNDYWEAGFKQAFHAVKLSDIPGWDFESELRVGIEGEIKRNDTYKINVYHFSGNPYQYGIR